MTETTPLVVRIPLLGERGCSPGALRLATCASAVAEGFDIGVYSGVLVRVNEVFALATWQVGLLTAILPLCIAAGAGLSAPVCDLYGRRPGLVLTYATLCTANAVMALAQSFLMLVLGRVVMGLGLGLGFATVAQYVTEIAPAESRGLYGALEDVFITFGILVGYLANYLLLGIPHDWRVMLALGGIGPLLFCCLFLGPWVPESPRYLLLKGRVEEARLVLDTMVGKTEAVATIEAWRKAPAEDAPQGLAALRALVDPPHRRRRLLAGVTCATVSMWSGIPIVSTLMAHLLAASMSASEAFLAQLVYGSAKFVAVGIVTVWYLDSSGRVPLLLASAVGCCGACGFLAYCFYADAAPHAFQMGMVAFGVLSSLGFGPVPFCYIPEVFDTHVRASGVAVSLAVSRVLVATMLFTTPLISHQVGNEAVFLILTGLNALSVPLVWLFLPETKSRKLEDLHEVFA